MLILLLLGLSIVFIIVSTTKFNLHAFLALLLAAIFFGLFSGMPFQEIISSIEQGFGGTIGKIGIVIIAGAIIGAFLEKSGGAYAMAEKIIQYIGKKNVPMAMSIIGYIVSIPVFADSGFVILSPLNKTLTKRAGISLATTAIALALGLMVTHTLMPPTPGPIAAAGILGADLGIVILAALPISIITLFFGWFWAIKFASRINIDPNPELTEAEFKTRLKDAPSAFHSFLPILIPILLIVFKSIADYPSHPLGETEVFAFINFVGHPIIALLIGILISITLPKKFDKKMLSSTGWVGDGLLSAAIIIMITGAGGAFGKVLQNSGIANVIGAGVSDISIGLWLPFIVAATIRAAQGSSTVAIITTASVLAPLLVSMNLDSEIGKALAVLAIGAGSIVASHANDSFFWVVTQLSGMDVKTGYKLMTTGTILMGTFACLIIWIASLIIL
ncbi:MAG: GntP family permease [Melioribacteraceae bacterium]|nr:GntP family permease [Melioribacteraceae bacterium]